MIYYKSIVEEIGLTGVMNPFGIDVSEYSKEYLH